MSERSALGMSDHLTVKDQRHPRRLHFCIDGQGPVTVLFEAGLGKSRSTWALAQPLVARFARTVVYDRAGLGRSDAAVAPRTFGALLRDHLSVLDTVVSGPCILVGHSYGGPIARLAAAERPDKVVGIVLVDEVSERAGADLLRRAMAGAGALYGGQVWLARVGLLGQALRRTYFRAVEGAALREVVIESGRVPAAKAARSEWQNMIAGMHDLEATGPHVPDIPLTEITSKRSSTPEEFENDFIYQSHKATAEAAIDGRHVSSRSRNHYIQLAEPRLVASEIERMSDRTRVRYSA
ncbi:Pimeloyl-ACP methyl ester carboxylesterase [Rhodococcoides kroppenstedtii]|uniref:Palmitoyl-protein thioesterase ABHD10, mitochondrial n=1 Tax=Rhodococcoides kroppenstedtii TaxID=293050 RepID=A0A1I0UDR5_9NOCA|nr:alpha/beta hydrolase [Rhodococcus kroppenstedtii]SFA62023.1 Pimeloyl-ACP methyl ester carboxylesterase [Rhodococcus kroppenstedtii]